MLAGLSVDKYHDYQCAQLVSEISELCESNDALMEKVKVTGNHEYEGCSEMIQWLEKSTKSMSSISSSMNDSLVSNAAFRKNYLKVVACVEFNALFLSNSAAEQRTCVKTNSFAMLKKMIGEFSSQGTAFISRSFDELLELLEIIICSQFYHIQTAGAGSRDGALQQINESILLCEVCRVVEISIESQSNQKKIFQSFTSKLLGYILGILDFVDDIPASIEQALNKLTGICLFRDQKEIEELASVHFNALPSEGDNVKKEADMDIKIITARTPQSYVASIFSAVSSHCARQRQRQYLFASDCDQPTYIKQLNSHSGISTLLSVYAHSSLRICKADSPNGPPLAETGAAAKTGKRKSGETSTLGVDAPIWRRHCQRVMSFAFELMSLLDVLCLVPFEQNISVGSTADNGIAIASTYIWGLTVRNSLLRALFTSLPGAISQHKSMLVFIDKLRTLSQRCMSLLRSVEGSQESVESSRKARALVIGSSLEQHNDLVEAKCKRICFVALTSSLASIAILECLALLMAIDHRVVLESVDSPDPQVILSTSNAVGKCKKSRTAEVEDVKEKSNDLNGVENVISAEMQEQLPGTGNWAEVGTRYLVRILVESVRANTGIQLSIRNALLVSDYQSQYRITSQQVPTINKALENLDLLSQQFSDARLKLLTALVDVYSDLRRLDLLLGVFMAADNIFPTGSAEFLSFDAWFRHQLIGYRGDKSIIEGVHYNTPRDATLGALLDEPSIQAKLSRVIMSLSNAQMIALWKAISGSTLSISCDSSINMPQRTILSSTNACKDDNSTHLYSISLIHPCACVLVKAVVSAALSSSEVAIASVQLKSVSTLLRSTSEMLRSYFHPHVLEMYLDLSEHQTMGSDLPTFRLRQSVSQSLNILASLTQLVSAVVSRYDVDEIKLTDEAALTPTDTTVGPNVFLASVLNECSQLGKIFSPLISSLIGMAAKTGSSSEQLSSGWLELFSRFRFPCCAAILSLMSVFMNASANGMKSWFGGVDVDSISMLLEDSLLTLLPSLSDLECLDHANDGYLIKPLQISTSQIGELVTNCLQIVVKALSVASIERPMNISQDLVTATFLSLLRLNLQQNICSSSRGFQSQINDDKGTMHLFGCNKVAHLLVRSREIQENPSICVSLLRSVSTLLHRCDEHLQQFYHFFNTSDQQVSSGGRTSGKKSKKKSVAKDDGIVPIKPADDIRRVVLELSRTDEEYFAVHHWLISLQHIFDFEVVIGSALSHEAGPEIVHIIAKLLYSICSTSCAISQTACPVSGDHKIVGQSFVEISSSLLVIILRRLWHGTQLSARVLDGGRIAVGRYSAYDVYKSLLVVFTPLLPGLMTSVASLTNFSNIDSVETKSFELAEPCESKRATCPLSDRVLHRTTLISMLCDALLLFAATDTNSREMPSSTTINVPLILEHTVDRVIDHLLLFTSSSGEQERPEPHYIAFCCNMVHTICNTCSALQPSLSAKTKFNPEVIEQISGRIYELFSALVHNWTCTAPAVEYEPSKRFHGLFQLLTADCIRAISSLCVEIRVGGQIDNGIGDSKLPVIGLLQVVLPYSFGQNAVPEENAPDKISNASGWLNLVGTLLLLNASLDNPISLSETYLSNAVDQILLALHTLAIGLESGFEANNGYLQSDEFGLVGLGNTTILSCVDVCVRGIVANIGASNTKILRRFCFGFHKILVAREHLTRCIRGKVISSFILKLSEACLLGTQTCSRIRNRQFTEFPNICVELFRCSCELMDMVCSFGLSTQAMLSVSPNLSLKQRVLGNKLVDQFLEALMLGFQVIRTIRFKRTAGVRNGKPDMHLEKVVEVDAEASADLSEKYFVVQWSNCCLRSLAKVAQFIIASGDRTRNSFSYMCSALEATLAQSKFETVGTSIGAISLLYRNFLFVLFVIPVRNIRPSTKSIYGVVAPVSNSEIEYQHCQALARSLNAAASNFELSKHSHLLVASIIECLAKHTTSSLSPTSLTVLSSGIFSLLDRCKPSQKKQLFGFLDSHGKLLFEELNSNYVRDFKFTGKA